MNVVLPAPLGPISAWRAPASSLKSMSCTALSAPKWRLSACVSSRVSVMTRTSARLRRPARRAPPPCRLAEAENSVAREQRDHHQQQAEAELPGGRIDLRQKMLQRQIDDGADERAVEPSIAAENENDEHGGGAVETRARSRLT